MATIASQSARKGALVDGFRWPLLVGVVGSVMVGLVGCSAPRPTMADLLDGRVAGAYQRLAIADVESRATWHLKAPGVTYLGNIVSTSCDEGQNNWKVHDGFRLRCRAASTGLYAWRGAFKPTKQKLLAMISDDCSGPEPNTASLGDPLATHPVSGGLFSCGLAGPMALRWAGTQAEPDDEFPVQCSDEQQRCVSGQTPELLAPVLQDYDWSVTTFISKVYFQDTP